MPNESAHGLLMAHLIQRVQDYLEEHPVGRCYVKTGCVLPGGHVVHPDVCVLLNEHLNRADGLIEGSPDWVAEILDEDDNPFSVSNHLQSYRQAGVREVWLVSCARRAVWVGYLHDAGWEALPREHAAIESHLLKGFTVEVDRFFPKAG